MSTIPLRDLHDRTSEILRQVQADNADVLVTRHGQPIARLSPVPSPPAEAHEGNGWQDYHRVAEEIRSSWPAGRPSQAVLTDVRR